MINAIDFLEYCCGLSFVLVSTATAYRLVKVNNVSKKINASVNTKKWEPIPDQTAEGLANRLSAFQSARFASPIVQRKFSNDASQPKNRYARFLDDESSASAVQAVKRHHQRNSNDPTKKEE